MAVKADLGQGLYESLLTKPCTTTLPKSATLLTQTAAVVTTFKQAANKDERGLLVAMRESGVPVGVWQEAAAVSGRLGCA